MIYKEYSKVYKVIQDKYKTRKLPVQIKNLFPLKKRDPQIEYQQLLSLNSYSVSTLIQS